MPVVRNIRWNRFTETNTASKLIMSNRYMLV
ncbi:hypothetical protein SAMN05414139_02061 [Burkholderia sp. D7]|nr:hypothetical protein SAMN05414139_02061 [Burkholderia sp. D7]